MIRLNDEYSISYKNGYFLTHRHAKRGDDSKKPGEEYTLPPKTYPTALRVWIVLKELGVDGNLVMQACDKLLKENQQEISKAYFKAKAAKEKKAKEKH